MSDCRQNDIVDHVLLEDLKVSLLHPLRSPSTVILSDY